MTRMIIAVTDEVVQRFSRIREIYRYPGAEWLDALVNNGVTLGRDGKA